ncbi:MAG: glycogen/starch/alpha-glucan phosphorylase [Rubrivivax sp.]
MPNTTPIAAAHDVPAHGHPPEPPSNTEPACDAPARLGAEIDARLRDELCVAPHEAGPQDLMLALAGLARAQLARRQVACEAADRAARRRRVHFLCMEFLIGRTLGNALHALGCQGAAARALQHRAARWEDVQAREADAALGNGGLGRLAACYLESMATLGLPAWGYCIRYEYGMFAQAIQEGQQVERPDPWLQDGAPWEFARPAISWHVGFGGEVQAPLGPEARVTWHPAVQVQARACDLVVPGHATERVSALRLWRSAAPAQIDMQAFNRGDYARAAEFKNAFENISWVLYPDDRSPAGRELRLRQEYFYICATLQDIVWRHLQEHPTVADLAQYHAIHLNDTHPALAVPELMRLLVDEHGLPWEAAWEQVRGCLSYTNHTLLPEALETWPVELLGRVLPRHLQIIRCLDAAWRAQASIRRPGDAAWLERIALIDSKGEGHVRMAHLAVAGSHHVNGVSALHGRLLRETVLADFVAFDPGRFGHVTNGVSQRRWLAQCNLPLASLVDEAIGPSWRRDLDALLALQPLADDAAFRQRFLAARRLAKQRLAGHIAETTGLAVDPDSLFDVQAKRIHKYKRQLLNLLQVIARWQAIRDAPDAPWVPRTVVMAGKAASGYEAARLIVRLAHDVGRVINGDPAMRGRLCLAFLPDYGVSLAELIVPAADLSEQILLAGTEASGTGNMKLGLNGALTIGTEDGSTIEMIERVGREQMFLFGLRAGEVAELRARGHRPGEQAAGNERLASALHLLADGAFSPGEASRYRELVEALLQRDPYCVLADFGAYLQAQAQADTLFGNPQAWAQRAVRTMAGMGHFSADRAVAEYAQHIWRVHPAP